MLVVYNYYVLVGRTPVIESKFAHSVAKLKEYVEHAKVSVQPLSEGDEEKVRVTPVV